MTLNTSLLFSIVVPVYNKERHLPRCMESIRRQKETRYEVIFICDPSNDNSTDYVERNAPPGARIFYRSTPGPGGYAARNLGIDRAAGTWIAFLDADDEWCPSHLEGIADAIDTHPGIEFFASRYSISGEGSRSDCDRITNVTSGSCRYLDFSAYLSNSPFYTSSVVAKKTLLKGIGGFPEEQMKRGGDVDTWLRAIDRARGMCLVNTASVVYHRDSDNMVTKKVLYGPSEIENGSLLKMIDANTGSIRRKLKRKYNNAVIYAWNQNMHLEARANFKLQGRLYISVQPVRTMLFIAFSNIPPSFALPIHHSLFRIIKRVRAARLRISRTSRT